MRKKEFLKKHFKAIILATCILVLFLIPQISYAASADLTQPINQATADIATTIQPVPKLILPLIEIVIAVLACIKLFSLGKQWFDFRGNDTETKEITGKIIHTIELAIASAIGAPIIIILINALFGTNLSS